MISIHIRVIQSVPVEIQVVRHTIELPVGCFLLVMYQLKMYVLVVVLIVSVAIVAMCY
jgi:hypothetical protein